jgi:Ca2+-binding RTX toxin-like protein
MAFTFSKGALAGASVVVNFSEFGVYLEGTDQNDSLHGGGADDGLYGLNGNDWLFGGGGRDTLDGGWGNDTLFGGAGDDTLLGDFGNDWLVGGTGADLLNGGGGLDTASYADAATGVSVDLGAGRGYTGDAAGDRILDIESLYGTNLGDIFLGSGLDNRLDGAGGDDWLFGKDGNDTLLGGQGGDVIKGGAGQDVIIGGAGSDTLSGHGETQFKEWFGADTFVFTPDSGGDTVTDFEVGVDKLRLEGWGSNPFGSDGRLAKGTDVLESSVKGTELFFDTDDHALYEITFYDDGGWFGPTTYSYELVATFTNGANLTEADFLFV